MMRTQKTLEELQAQNFGHTLFLAARLLDEVAQALVNLEAKSRVARPAVMRLVPFLDQQGIRPSVLAKRVDLSKQAVGQALAELKRQKLVVFERDKNDGRAMVVRLSSQGHDAFVHGLGILEFLEGELKKKIKPRKVNNVFKGLSLMLPILLEWQKNGAPKRKSK